MNENWYDPHTGTVDRRIFSDQAIYEQELEHIFRRSWNFICHESQLPEVGSFFSSYIGEDQVIAVRDRQRNIAVLLNSCPHRGNTVCRAELGKTNSFLCSYHGWNFDLDGTLLAVPGEERFYRNQLDKSQWGLASAAQVDTYGGFVFATLDPGAPPLHDFLGWVGRLGLDMLTSQGELQAVDGVQKNLLQCNWKLAVDNLYDWYHVNISHGTAFRIGLLSPESMAPDQQMVLLGEYGHGVGGPGLTADQWQAYNDRASGKTDTPPDWFDVQASRRLPAAGPISAENQIAAEQRMGPVGVRSLGHPNIFPNLWVALTRQVCLRIPRGPHATELWWFTFLPKDLPEKERRLSMFMANHVFGPGGFLEQDDGENWSHSTRGAKGPATRERPLNFSMGLGQDQVTTDPSGQQSIETVVNEHGQRWTYQSWQEWMHAESWEQLIKQHSMPPDGTV